MKVRYLLLSVAPLALATPAFADSLIDSTTSAHVAGDDHAQSPAQKPKQEVFSTGVAKGRDILDAAISTSSLKETEIEKYGARSLGEVLRNIPGLRVEYSGGEGMSNITIRGLPLAQSGSKFMQLQEDGLPVLEFGDITQSSSDLFLRTDLSLAHVEAIRGGSASTFASNSPGGVVNLMDKTGDITGGSVQASTGLNYGEYRADFDYGAKINDDWKFHVGGFFRTGEGPRSTGYKDAFKGGQIKFNVTRSFDGGYVRLYAKFLDDRTPPYMQVPIGVSGTNANPTYFNLPGLTANSQTLLSRNIVNTVTLDANNSPITVDMHDGMHAKEKSVGLEGQYNLGGWSFTDKFRYSAKSANTDQFLGVPSLAGPAANIAAIFAGPGAHLTYATGPLAGATINPLTVNGNGVLDAFINAYIQAPDLDYLVNDLRATRVWKVGGGELTTTAGFYKSRQTIAENWLWNSMFMDVVGGGNAALVNVSQANNAPQTLNGVFGYGAYFYGGAIRQSYKVNYDVNAPYGSMNFHVGKLSVGASIRYDSTSAKGVRHGGGLDGTADTTAYDFLGNGTLIAPEQRVGHIPAGDFPVDYSVHYVSYSAGVNYRIADPLSVFARYSKGGRAGADRLLYLFVNRQGQLSDPSAGVDYVHQTEVGVKYRKADLALFLTGFLATATEHNFLIDRSYRAYGLEFEGSWHHGPFGVTAGATWTHGEISSDKLNPSDVGNTPQHQPKLLFQVMPQYETGRFAVGANIVGQTDSYADNSNQLKMPGYTIVSPFVQYRPAPRLLVSLNVNNVFNVLALTEVSSASLPASGITQARVLNGRTISTSLRFDF